MTKGFYNQQIVKDFGNNLKQKESWSKKSKKCIYQTFIKKDLKALNRENYILKNGLNLGLLELYKKDT